MSNEYLIAGYHSVLAAIQSGRALKVYLDKEKNNLLKNIKFKNLNLVNNSQLSKLIKDNSFNHQGIVALVKKKELTDIEKFTFKENFTGILLNQISDQRNIGSILRSALAFNVNLIVLEKKFYNEKSLHFNKSSSGALDFINLCTVSNINNFIKKFKNQIYFIAMDSNAEKNINDVEFPKKTAFVFGSENKGLQNNVSENCDIKCKININKNIDSLNVSNAVTSVLTLRSLG